MTTEAKIIILSESQYITEKDFRRIFPSVVVGSRLSQEDYDILITNTESEKWKKVFETWRESGTI